MAKYEINVDGVKYQINSNKELDDSTLVRYANEYRDGAGAPAPKKTTAGQAFSVGMGQVMPGAGLATRKDTIDVGNIPGIKQIKEERIAKSEAGQPFIPYAERNVVTRAASRFPEVVKNVLTGGRPIVPEPTPLPEYSEDEFKFAPAQSESIDKIREEDALAEKEHPIANVLGKGVGTAGKIAVAAPVVNAAISGIGGAAIRAISPADRYLDAAIAAVKSGKATKRQIQGIRLLKETKSNDVNNFINIINKYLLPEGAKEVPAQAAKVAKDLSPLIKGALNTVKKTIAGTVTGAGVKGSVALGRELYKGTGDVEEILKQTGTGAKTGAAAGLLPGSAARNAAFWSVIMSLMGTDGRRQVEPNIPR